MIAEQGNEDATLKTNLIPIKITSNANDKDNDIDNVISIM